MELNEKKQVLRAVAASLISQFQKRGLSLAHCVIPFTPQHFVDNAQGVDELVTAEIPVDNTNDREHVAEFMVYVQCLPKQSARCRQTNDGMCRHYFP